MQYMNTTLLASSGVFRRKTTPPHREYALQTPGLLLACRQIHSETALLPYSKSLLSTHDLTHFAKWLATRSSAQVNAITRLELQCGLTLDDYGVRHCTLHVNMYATLRQFPPRLKHLHLKVDVTYHPIWTCDPCAGWVQLLVGDMRRCIEHKVPGVKVTVQYAATLAVPRPINLHSGITHTLQESKI